MKVKSIVIWVIKSSSALTMALLIYNTTVILNLLLLLFEGWYFFPTSLYIWSSGVSKNNYSAGGFNPFVATVVKCAHIITVILYSNMMAARCEFNIFYIIYIY